jgi:hypothetical protein
LINYLIPFLIYTIYSIKRGIKKGYDMFVGFIISILFHTKDIIFSLGRKINRIFYNSSLHRALLAFKQVVGVKFFVYIIVFRTLVILMRLWLYFSIILFKSYGSGTSTISTEIWIYIFAIYCIIAICVLCCIIVKWDRIKYGINSTKDKIKSMWLDKEMRRTYILYFIIAWLFVQISFESIHYILTLYGNNFTIEFVLPFLRLNAISSAFYRACRLQEELIMYNLILCINPIPRASGSIAGSLASESIASGSSQTPLGGNSGSNVISNSNPNTTNLPLNNTPGYVSPTPNSYPHKFCLDYQHILRGKSIEELQTLWDNLILKLEGQYEKKRNISIFSVHPKFEDSIVLTPEERQVIVNCVSQLIMTNDNAFIMYTPAGEARTYQIHVKYTALSNIPANTDPDIPLGLYQRTERQVVYREFENEKWVSISPQRRFINLLNNIGPYRGRISPLTHHIAHHSIRPHLVTNTVLDPASLVNYIAGRTLDVNPIVDPATIAPELNPASIAPELNPASIAPELNPASVAVARRLNPATIARGLNSAPMINPQAASQFSQFSQFTQFTPDVPVPSTTSATSATQFTPDVPVPSATNFTTGAATQPHEKQTLKFILNSP